LQHIVLRQPQGCSQAGRAKVPDEVATAWTTNQKAKHNAQGDGVQLALFAPKLSKLAVDLAQWPI